MYVIQSGAEHRQETYYYYSLKQHLSFMKWTPVLQILQKCTYVVCIECKSNKLIRVTF